MYFRDFLSEINNKMGMIKNYVPYGEAIIEAATAETTTSMAKTTNNLKFIFLFDFGD